jgi:type II secretory pathway pseudopilin PulG
MKNLFILHKKVSAGFSLVEVVVAVGVFAIAIVSVIGIIAGVGRSVEEVSGADKAARLIGVIQSRLQDTGFARVEKAIDDGTIFFASEDGSIVGPDTGPGNVWTAGNFSNALKYFELTLIRNTSLSPVQSGGGPDVSSGFLAFNIRLRWPAYLPNGTRVTDDSQKEVLIVPAAITR